MKNNRSKPLRGLNCAFEWTGCPLKGAVQSDKEKWRLKRAGKLGNKEMEDKSLYDRRSQHFENKSVMKTDNERTQLKG